MVRWVKEHPYLTGATVVGIFILFLLLRRRRGAAAAAQPGVSVYGPSEGLQAAQLQAGTAVQGMLLSAQAQHLGLQQQQNIAELNQAGETARTRIAAGVTSEQIQAALKLGLVQTASGLALVGAEGHVTETPGSIVFGSTQAIKQQQAAAAAQQQAISQAVASIPAATAPVPLPAIQLPGSSAPYVVGGGGPGAEVHGVDTMLCDQSTVAGQFACSQQNQAVINQSYAEHPGSYLGGGVYAQTCEAWAVYGDPSLPCPYGGGGGGGESYSGVPISPSTNVDLNLYHSSGLVYPRVVGAPISGGGGGGGVVGAPISGDGVRIILPGSYLGHGIYAPNFPVSYPRAA